MKIIKILSIMPMKYQYVYLAACFFIIAGCGPKLNVPVPVMNDSGFYVKNGNEFFENGQIDKALESFNNAAKADPKYWQAYIGRSLVYLAKKDYVKALDDLKLGENYGAGIEANIGYIRFYSEKKGEGWIKEAESAYRNGMKIDLKNERLYYFMGRVYKQNYEFNKASIIFRKVIEMNKEYVKKANEEWELIQEIQRASPSTNIGHQIALAEKISRADAAALFIEELKLDELYGKKIRTSDIFYSAPEGKKPETKEIQSTAKVTDIKDHLFKVDIEKIIIIGVRGLVLFNDNTFLPYKLITRAEYAVMIEDILVKVTGDKTILNKYSGNESLFPDVGKGHNAFNAIMVTTGRGILPTKINGEFGPEENISGAGALLAIKKLKEELKL